MNRTVEVCLAGLILVAGVVTTNEATAQTLQRGISVNMVSTSHAVPMPEADNADAWIVAVTSNRDLYFGLNRVTAESLLEEMKSRPRDRKQKLYIKADARARYADVERVLEAGRAVGFESLVLLTSERERSAPGTIVPPKGLEVLVGAPASAEAVVVQVLDLGEPKPDVRVNGADVSIDVLQNTLGRMRLNRKVDLIVVKATGTLPFAQVAHVIDECKATGAKVVLAKL